jgi:hypothetical protein
MKNFIAPFLTLASLSVMLVFAANIKTDYNHSADFSAYKTYSWIQIKADPLWVDRITGVVDHELNTKGWAEVAESGDAGVAAFSATHEVPTMETFYTGFGGGWRWRGGIADGFATTTVEKTPVGTLTIDLFDGHTKKLIWRGMASEALSNKPEKDEKKMEKAVEAMFKHFPPPPRD